MNRSATVLISRAELLRRLTPGAKLTLVYRSSDGPKNLPREMIRASAHSLFMKGPDYPFNRVHLAKAKIYATATGFELRWPEVPGQCDQKFLRYDWASTEQLPLDLAKAKAVALLASIRGSE